MGVESEPCVSSHPEHDYLPRGRVAEDNIVVASVIEQSSCGHQRSDTGLEAVEHEHERSRASSVSADEEALSWRA